MLKIEVFSGPAMRRWTKAGFAAVGIFVLAGSISAYAADATYALTPITALGDTVPQIPGGPSLQFVGSQTGSWESNPLMQFTGAKELYGSVTSPELIFNGKTPTSLLSVDTLVNENLFNLTGFDSTDLHTKVNFNEQMERWGFQIQQQTDYDTTRTSEIFPVGVNNVISDVPVRHLGLAVAPQLSYSPTSLDKVSLASSFQYSDYDNPIFVNYDQASIMPSYQHSFDPLNAGIISLQAQRYNSLAGPQVTVDSVGPSVGWIGTLTPQLTIKASLGVQSSRQYGAGVTQSAPWSLQYVYAGDVSYKGIQDTTHFIATRADYPFGNGTESLLTTYSVTEQHSINELFALNVGASYQASSYLVNSPGNLDYVLSGNGGVTYHATERLDLTATYQYRRETLLSTPGDAHDHLVTFGLVYRPLPWSL